jgi:hypothetical protein
MIVELYVPFVDNTYMSEFIAVTPRTEVNELVFSEPRTLIDATTLPLLGPVREVVRRYRGVRGRAAGVCSPLFGN